jgi:hypothetical protein
VFEQSFSSVLLCVLGCGEKYVAVQNFTAPTLAISRKTFNQTQ